VAFYGSAFFFAWCIVGLDGNPGEITLLASFCRGFQISPIASVVSLIWALADGVVRGVILACLFTLVSTRRQNEG
jgi:hypothetical protein